MDEGAFARVIADEKYENELFDVYEGNLVDDGSECRGADEIEEQAESVTEALRAVAVIGLATTTRKRTKA